jgi:predicted ATPase
MTIHQRRRLHTPYTNSRLAISVRLRPKGGHAVDRPHLVPRAVSGAGFLRRNRGRSAQADAAEAFAALEERLSSYKPVRKQSLLGRLFGDKSEPPPRGLYVHGEVGRGKTMLMDLFFQHSPVQHKRRAHFHEFMAEVHEKIYSLPPEHRAR